MLKNGLFVMSIGLLIMMMSAVGNGMIINYSVLITGGFILAVGYLIYRKGKAQGIKKSGGENKWKLQKN
ncbi:hypothetical protein [Carnobacterium divergens]|nr:hypothetical protein [Carnobacterium divergens]MDO0875250.1 DUF3188 domain-containing protein [Carnobacterium divergens]SUX17472.1 Uncharacterised protein [Carnobacterium divergens]